MLEGLFSSEGQFRRGFADIAHSASDAAVLLRDALNKPAKRPENIEAIRALVEETAATAHALQVRAFRTFLTPIDREDVVVLVARLEAVLTTVERSAWMTQAMHLDGANQAADRLAATLARSTEELEAAVRHLPDATRVTANTREVKRLEEEGDAVFGEAMSALFAGAPDPLEALRWKEMYGNLEEALDTCAHAAGTVEGLSLKRL